MNAQAAIVMAPTLTMANPTDQPYELSKSAVKVMIKDLSFFYGQIETLKKISLPLHEHRVTAFVGPSGCGKSTLCGCSTAGMTFTRPSGRRVRWSLMAKTSWIRNWT